MNRYQPHQQGQSWNEQRHEPAMYEGGYTQPYRSRAAYQGWEGPMGQVPDEARQQQGWGQDYGQHRSSGPGRYDEGLPLGAEDYEQPGSAQGYQQGWERPGGPPRSDERYRSPNQATSRGYGPSHRGLEDYGTLGAGPRRSGPQHAGLHPQQQRGRVAPRDGAHDLGDRRGGALGSSYPRNDPRQEADGARGFRRQRQGGHYGRGAKGYTRSDERIGEEVNDRLMYADDIDPGEVEVSVKDGVVTLSGTVEDRSDKFYLEQIAEQVLGVKDVMNQVRVNRRRDEERTSPRGGPADADAPDRP